MNTRLGLALLFALGFCFAIGSAASAQQTTSLSDSQMPSVIAIPGEAQPSDSFSAEAASNAYLAQIPAAARARSDAYFEGGYWLILWDFLLAVIVYWVLLRLGWSARMRRFAEHLTRLRVLQNFFYWIQFMLITFVLTFPLTVYEGFFREWKYGLATQTFGPWMGDQIKGLLIAIILGGIVAVVLLEIVRWLPNTWHIWGAIVTTLFMIAAIMIAPVYLLPLFNKVTKLDDPKVTQPILSMARANGIPAHDVFEVDASRQTTRMSANVSGFGRTMRITLNDNLLRRGSPEEIQSVMGHEMGHYVLHHIYKDVLFLFVVTVAFFALLRWGLRYSLARWGTKWGVQEITDPAVIPLVFLIATIFFFALTPVSNTQTRTEEAEADMFGLNASRQPDGFAQAAIHLGEYRKMSPGSVEEWIFFDHPSGRNRIYRAMRWKAENLQLFQPSQKP
jgi:STE24 endopeptidase